MSTTVTRADDPDDNAAVEALYRSYVFAGDKLLGLRAAFEMDLAQAHRYVSRETREASEAFIRNRLRIIEKILQDREEGV